MRSSVFVLLLALVLISQASPSVYGAPDDEVAPSPNQSLLLRLKQAAEARRDELLYLFDEEIPVEVLAKFQEAISLMDEAEENESQNMLSDTRTYMESLKMFREAWEAYSNYNPDAGEESLVVVDDDTKPENIPPGLEAAIQHVKEERIVKFQEKLIDVLDDEESAPPGKSSLYENVRSNLQSLNKLIQQGALSSALDALRITMMQLEDQDGLSEKQVSKLTNTVSRLEDKVAKEEDKDDKGNSGKPEAATEDDQKSNNGNGKPEKDDKENGNGNPNTDDPEPSDEAPDQKGNGKPEKEYQNNGKQKTQEPAEPEDPEPNGNGNEDGNPGNSSNSAGNPKFNNGKNGG